MILRPPSLKAIQRRWLTRSTFQKISFVATVRSVCYAKLRNGERITCFGAVPTSTLFQDPSTAKCVRDTVRTLQVDAGAVRSIQATNVSTATNAQRTRTAAGMANVSIWKALLHFQNDNVSAKWVGSDHCATNNLPLRIQASSTWQTTDANQ